MSIVELTDSNFKDEVENSELPVIIDFYADWCGPCKALKPVFEELSKDYAGKLKFAKMDIDAYGKYASQYGIQSIPTLVVTKDGKKIDYLVGLRPKDTLRKDIDGILKDI